MVRIVEATDAAAYAHLILLWLSISFIGALVMWLGWYRCLAPAMRASSTSPAAARRSRVPAPRMTVTPPVASSSSSSTRPTIATLSTPEVNRQCSAETAALSSPSTSRPPTAHAVTVVVAGSGATAGTAIATEVRPSAAATTRASAVAPAAAAQPANRSSRPSAPVVIAASGTSSPRPVAQWWHSHPAACTTSLHENGKPLHLLLFPLTLLLACVEIWTATTESAVGGHSYTIGSPRTSYKYQPNPLVVPWYVLVGHIVLVLNVRLQSAIQPRRLLLAAGCWLLAAGCRLPAAGCWPCGAREPSPTAAADASVSAWCLFPDPAKRLPVLPLRAVRRGAAGDGQARRRRWLLRRLATRPARTVLALTLRHEGRRLCNPGPGGAAVGVRDEEVEQRHHASPCTQRWLLCSRLGM